MHQSTRVQELQATVSRQQQTIKKLQNEIRERCQSYLLHASRHKPHPTGRESNESREQSGSHLKEPGRPTEEKKSAREEDSEAESFSDSPPSQALIEDQPQPRWKKLAISREIDIREEYHLREAEREAQTAEIIESYKQRFALLQRTKNDATKEVDKLQLENKELKDYVLQLQRNLEKTTKAENKLRDKLKRMPQYEASINEIYIKLMAKIKGEEESDRLSLEDKHTNAKIEDILKWIAESMGKVDSILEGFAAEEVQSNSRDMQYESITKPFQPEADIWSSVQKQGQ